MRARLYADGEPDALAREAQAFFDGSDTTFELAAVFLIDDGGAPLGFIELAIRAFSDGCDSAPVPHVEGWYVEPAARGRGAGRALVAYAEDWARAQGFRELASDTNLENDDSARAHVACGFQEVERLIKFRKALV